MGSYDFFSQPQGPQISVSLFNDAKAQGAAYGHSVPNQFTAIAGGVLEGLQTGENLVKGYQEIQSNKTAEAINQQKLQADKDANVANDLKAQITADNAATTAATAKDTSILEAKQAKDKLADATLQDKILTDASSNDPTIAAGVWSDPANKKMLSSNPQYAEQIFAATSSSLNDQQKADAYAMIAAGKQQQFDIEKQKIEATGYNAVSKSYVKAFQDFNNSAAFQSITKDMKDVPEVTSRIEVYPKGTKQLNALGKLSSDLPDKISHNSADVGHYTVYKDKVPQFDVLEPDANKFFALKSADGAHTALINRQIFGQFQPSGRVANAQQHGSNSTPANEAGAPPTATPVPALLGSSPTPTPVSGAQPFGGPASIVTSGNQAIVDQSRKSIEQLNSNPPKGIQRGSLMDRLQARKAALNANIAQLQQRDNAAAAVGDYKNQVQGINKGPIVATPLNPKPIGTPPSEVPTMEESLQGLNGVLKRDVSLNITSIKPAPQKVIETINSDPLLSGETPLVKGVAAVESRGDRNAVSPTGVVGLMQVTKATAAAYGLNRDIPEENVLAGKLALNDNLIRFDGNLHLALAAYNAGPGVISDAIRHTQSTDWQNIKGYLSEHLSAKKYKEVSQYPDKVIHAATRFVGNNSEADTNFAYGLIKNNLLIGV